MGIDRCGFENKAISEFVSKITRCFLLLVMLVILCVFLLLVISRGIGIVQQFWNTSIFSLAILKGAPVCAAGIASPGSQI